MNQNYRYDATNSIFRNPKVQKALKYLIDNDISNVAQYLFDSLNHYYSCYDRESKIIQKIFEILARAVGETLYFDQIISSAAVVKCSAPCDNSNNLPMH
ncbi:MAG: hypothetical protein HRK26_02255 [Rickettsiaceae bacterium H1]|nr:hypothetical protein [Rickettsiaceae bacterium H1]